MNSLNKRTALLGLVVMLCAQNIRFGNREHEVPKQFPPVIQRSQLPESAEAMYLGKKLFFDEILSRDYTISCASCHKPEFAFSDYGKRFSKGVDDRVQRRNTPSLFNLAWSNRFFWDGRAGNLEEQAYEVIRGHTEMDMNWSTVVERLLNIPEYERLFSEAYPNSQVDSLLIANALTQFQLSLVSSNSKYDKVLRGELAFTEEEYKGFVFVNDQSMGNCLQCHTTDAHALGTNGSYANNGLDSISQSDLGVFEATKIPGDSGKFKVPSLRNLLFTAPYMHDGRFETLREVLDFYSEGVEEHPQLHRQMNYYAEREALFTEEEKDWMLAFLKTLTDSTFVQNENFSIHN